MNELQTGDRVRLIHWARDRSLDEDAVPSPGAQGHVVARSDSGVVHISWDNGLQGAVLPTDTLETLSQ